MPTINDIYTKYPIKISADRNVRMLAPFILSEADSKDLIAEILNRPKAVSFFEERLKTGEKGTMTATGPVQEVINCLKPLEQPLTYIQRILESWVSASCNIQVVVTFGESQ